MAERILLDDLGHDTDEESAAAFLKKFGVDADLKELLPIVKKIARPKALLAWADCEVLDEKHVKIDDRVFESIVLADKLKELHRVLLFVVTAGKEISECVEIENEKIRSLLAGAVLTSARRDLMEYIEKELGMTGLSALNPGSLPDWPIANNHMLCDIIGNVGEIGISLNEAGYMTPWNSGSGIFFTGGDGYQNCSICTRLDCIGRRAKFNESEYNRLFK